MVTAWMLSQHSSCCSKKVGAILVKDNRILSSGYNGTQSGDVNCNDHFNKMGYTVNGKNLSSEYRHEHREWSMVNEHHAEANALDYASKHGVSIEGSTLFVSLSPCIECCKRIANSGIVRLVYSKEYDFAFNDWKKYLRDKGIIVDKISTEELQHNNIFINSNLFEFDMVKDINK